MASPQDSTPHPTTGMATFELYFFSLIVQAILYGTYLPTFVYCLRWLVYDDNGWYMRERIHWPMLTASIAIFLLSTTHLGLLFWSTFGPAAQLDVPQLYKLDAIGVCMYGTCVSFVVGLKHLTLQQLAFESAIRLIIDGVLVRVQFPEGRQTLLNEFESLRYGVVGRCLRNHGR